MKTKFMLFLFLVYGGFTFSQDEVSLSNGKKIVVYPDKTWEYTDKIPLYNVEVTSISHLEIPKTTPSDVIITHSGFSLSFSTDYLQSKWVAYELTREETQGGFDRANKFKPDPDIKAGNAKDKDYAKSGYDKGHLAPAADMAWSEQSMAESFYYSNISPQESGFNRGIWKRLEEQVREWAVDNEAVYIVVGPVLSKGLNTIGPDKVAVPKYFYKVVLDYRTPGLKGIGFIFSNTSSSENLQSYAVTIDSVQKFTGIDFFPLLPKKQVKILEGTINVMAWKWKPEHAKKTEE